MSSEVSKICITILMYLKETGVSQCAESVTAILTDVRRATDV